MTQSAVSSTVSVNIWTITVNVFDTRSVGSLLAVETLGQKVMGRIVDLAVDGAFSGLHFAQFIRYALNGIQIASVITKFICQSLMLVIKR